MRVLLVSHSSTLVGGAERSLLEIAGFLAAQDGVSVLLAVPAEGDLAAAARARRIDVDVLPYGWATADRPADVRRTIAALDRLRRYLASRSVDVVFTNTSVVPWFAYLAHQLGFPHACFLREDVTAQCSAFAYPNSDEHLALIKRYSDALFVNSQYMRERYAAALGRDDIEVVYPTIGEPISDHLKCPPRARRPDKPFRIIQLGTIDPRKNQLELLQAARLLRLRGQRIRVTVMGNTGDAGYRAALHRFVDDNDMCAAVRFLDHRDNPYPTIRAHDAVVVPSVAEPFGRVTIEAMLLATPVIASESGANAETIASPAVGRLYPPGDPDALADRVEQLINDPEAAQAMAERARTYACDRFMTDRGLGALLATLERLAQLDKPPRGDWITDLVVSSAVEDAAAAKDREAELQTRLTAARQRIAVYEGSTSWRLTRPLRAVGDAARRRRRGRGRPAPAVSGVRIAVVIDPLERPAELEHDYAIGAIARIWRSAGHEVRFIPADRVDGHADVCLLHVDRTVVPHTATDAAQRYPRAINASITDIRKTKVTMPDVWPDADYAGPVFVKSDMNSDGVPERRLDARAGRASPPLGVKTYEMFASPADVPADVLHRPGAIVQKFMPEFEDGAYHVRRCFVFGSRVICYRKGNTTPVVDAHASGLFEWIEPDPGVVDWCRELGLEFGTFEWIRHEGKAIVIDVNKTPGLSHPPDEQGVLDYARIIEFVAQGLADFVSVPAAAG